MAHPTCSCGIPQRACHHDAVTDGDTSGHEARLEARFDAACTGLTQSELVQLALTALDQAGLSARAQGQVAELVEDDLAPDEEPSNHLAYVERKRAEAGWT